VTLRGEEIQNPRLSPTGAVQMPAITHTFSTFHLYSLFFWLWLEARAFFIDYFAGFVNRHSGG